MTQKAPGKAHRDRHTILQMQSVVAGMVGKRLLYRRLVS